jgi:hypothetical protein
MKKASIPTPKNRRMGTPFEVMQEASGLCACCNSFNTCTYSKDPKRPILQCEEFDGIVLSSLRMVPHGKIVPKGFEETPNPSVSDLAPYRGLCSLCEDRLTCTYPKPEGGVWHCEEYQ